MTTTKSFSDKPFSERDRAHGVFLSSMRRQMSFMVATFIILFITMVVPYLVSSPGRYLEYYNFTDVTEYFRETFRSGIYFSEGQPIFIAVVLSIMALACALSATRYMHSMKMVDLYHSLPVRREKMLLTNLSTSMLAVLGPFLLLYLVTMAGQMIAYGSYGWVGPWYFQYAGMDFLTIAVMVFVIYAFTTFVAVNVGTTFDSLAITGALGAMPTIVFLISGAIWEMSCYGASFNYENCLRLSPFLFFFERIRYSENLFYYSSRLPKFDYGMISVIFGIWLALGCVLFAAAIFCYRRRKSESAEQTQPRGVLQMIVKFFAAFCGGAMFMAIFYDKGSVTQFIAIIFGALAIGMIADLILTRNIRSLVKNIKWLALAGLVYAFLYIGVQQDFFGYVRRVPATDNVSSVSISYRGRFTDEYSNPITPQYTGDNNRYETTLTQPQSIDVVRAAHAAAVEAHNRSDDYYWGGYVTIRYNLKNGSSLIRRYYNVGEDAYQILAGMEANEDFIRQSHPLFFMEEYAKQPGIRLEISAAASSVTNNVPRALRLGAEDLNSLISAMQTDILTESLDDIYNSASAPRGYIRLTYRQAGGAGTVNLGGLDDALAEYEYYAYDDYQKQRLTDRSFLTECWVPIFDHYHGTLSLMGQLNLTDYLQPDLDDIAEARILDVTGYGNYDDNRVVQAMSNEYYAYRYWGDKGDPGVFTTQSQEDIAAIIAGGKTRLLLTPEARKALFYVHFLDSNEEVCGGIYIDAADLPEPMRSTVEQYLMDNRNDTSYSIIPAMPTAEVLMTASPIQFY